MRPVLLKIKGLNSFEEEQVVDFEKLTSKGLFGIFGTTGSGKTSIIDAMTLALYGELSRYEGEGGSKKFINVNMDSSKVSLEFVISGMNGEERYVVERGYKKHNESQKVVLARLYKKTEVGEEILAEKTTQVTDAIENIIGLAYKDFSRTVILPQGKFSEFLLLANTERRNMLERVFHLEKYGENLLGVIRSENNGKVQDLKILNTKLDMYGDVTLELIEQNKEKLSALSTELDGLKKKQKEVTEETSNLKNTQVLCKQIKSYENKLSIISNRDEEIENCKKFLIRAKQARLVIPSYIEVSETRRLSIENEENLKSREEKCDKLGQEEKESLEKLNEIINLKNEELPKLDEKELDLREAINLSKDKEKIELERERLLKEHKDIKVELKNVENKKTELESQKQVLKEDIKNMTERKKVIQETLCHKKNVEDAFGLQVKIKEFEKKLKELIKKYKNYKKQILRYQDKLKEIEKGISLCEVEILKICNYIGNEHKIIKEQTDKIQGDVENTEKELLSAQLKIQENEKNSIILRITEELEDGQPCPVCGSDQHDTSTYKPFGGNINLLLENEKELKLSLENQRNNLNLCKEKLLKLEILNKEFKIYKSQNRIQASKEDELENIDLLELEDISKELKNEVNSLKTEKEVLLVSIQKDEEVFSILEEEIKEIENYMDKNKEELEEAYKKLSTKDIQGLNQTIKLYEDELVSIVNREELNNKKTEELNIQLEKLNTKYQGVKSKSDEVIAIGKEKSWRIKELQAKILELSKGKELNECLREIKEKKEMFSTGEEKARIAHDNISKELSKESEAKAGLKEKKLTLDGILVKKEKDIEKLIRKHDFKSIDNVLKYNITEEKENLKENEIKLFENEKNDVLNNIERLKKETENVDITNIDERLKSSINEKESVDSKILEYTQQFGVTKQNISQMQADFNNITVLDKERKSLSAYIDILAELSKVLEGKKFVEFVAKKQLRYIVIDASSRLKDMSRGRYALELDDTDFVIRDDHYGGLRRSPKTLSGGETFMASLCLALALSSKIQLKNKSTLELFFLDEGFGTLDLESLNVVMNSLIKLQSQKMRVGVISHVEEMKSRIPVKLEVTPANQGMHGTLVHLE